MFSQQIICLLPRPVCGVVPAKTPSFLGFSIYQIKLNTKRWFLEVLPGRPDTREL